MVAIPQQALLSQGPLGDPQFPNVKFLSGFQGLNGATTLTTEDSSARVVTFAGNAKIDTSQFKFGTSSLFLDGAGDIVTVPNSVDFQFGTGPWTVETWRRFAVVPSSGVRSTLVALYDGAAGQRSWDLTWNGIGSTDVILSTNGTSASVALSQQEANNLNPNVWYFFEFNYDGTNLRVFRDGAFKGKALFSGALFASAAALSIGGFLSSGVPGGDYFNGWVGDTRITKGLCRNPSDANYTAPTTPFPRS